MDDRRVGWLIRRIRQHLGLRQLDVASLSGVSQSVISDLELGRLDVTPLRTIRAVLGSLGASGDLVVRWRGGDLDRLADEDHARLVGTVVRWLGRLAWTVLPEVTYSVYGERGAIDVVAWHDGTRTLLIIEVKTELTSIEATLRKHDEKVRLGARIVRERFGWEPRTVGRLLVLPDTSTARRRVARHGGVLVRAYPARGQAIRQFLRRPAGAFAGLRFLSPTRGGGARRTSLARKRVFRRQSSVGAHAGEARGSTAAANTGPGGR